MMSSCGRDGIALRPAGRGTKAWGAVTREPDVEIKSDRLNRLLEHNTGDFTAVLQAGITLAEAQEQFAEANQMLALDPPLENEQATIGGIVATGDSGPLRHGFKSARDLMLGMTVALSDGTVASSGGRVIKNVAGYDLAKLFTGSMGTLGMILEVTVRLHPRPPGSATAIGHAADPQTLGAAGSALAHAQIETNSLDVSWAEGEGHLLARYGGAEPARQAEAALKIIEDAGIESELTEDDDDLWDRQRAGQRSKDGVVVKVSALQEGFPTIFRAADAVGASVVGRAGLGLSWVKWPADDPGELTGAVEELRRRLEPFACSVLDAPPEVRSKADVWGAPEGGALDLMRRVKARFDPANVCNPGVFVGGI